MDRGPFYFFPLPFYHRKSHLRDLLSQLAVLPGGSMDDPPIQLLGLSIILIAMAFVAWYLV
jgi:hypothetical protein